MLRAANFRFNIDIYKPVIIKNEYGEQVQTYNKINTTKSKVEFINGSAEIQNLGAVNTYSIKFTIRGYNDIQNDYLIYYDNEKYSIDSIDYDKLNMVKIIKCNKVQE